MADRDRVLNLACGDRVTASLSYYPAGEHHPPHAHDFTQISFVLAGELSEDHGRRSFEVGASGIGVKPAGLSHSDRWGRHGALIFSLWVKDGGMADRFEPAAGWRRAHRAAAPLVGALLLSDADGREDAAHDLLGEVEGARGDWRVPPVWLSRAREDMRDDPSVSIAAIARRAGVHRVHFSQAFHQAFGLPPSLYRRRLLAARGVAGTVAGSEPLAQVAYAAGFSDQAHMARVVREETGLAPSRLRGVFENLTSVQAAAAA